MLSRVSPTRWVVFSVLCCSLAMTGGRPSLAQELDLSGPVPPAPTAAEVVDAPDLPEGAEVMVTGPLHEAFAEQFSDEAEPGIVISKRPPELINEIPPDYRPEGEEIVWIPGYWGWDPEREDFLWITGIWRQVPPDRRWVPGYWAEINEGYQWIAGFWSLNATAEIRYLPVPPQALAADPSTPAPSEEHFWIPGQWNYVNDDYQWRAGYWTMGYPDWVWVPDRYVWTPSGCIYRAGYWDYEVVERGTVFCPVYWAQQPVVNYSFRPTYVVNTGPNLLANLFVYPRYHHYFFGNYYSSRFLGNSIYPWVTYGQQSRRYDPLYGYYRTQYRDNDYLNRVTRLHNYYAANVNYQPPRTLTAQRAYRPDLNNRQDLNFHAMQLNKMINRPNNINYPMQLVKLADNERQQIQRGLDPAREIWKQRAQFEGKSRPGTPGDGRNDRDGRSDRDGRNDRDGDSRGPNNRADWQDRRWNLPQGQDGVRLGSIAVGNTRQRDGDLNGNGDRDRNDRISDGTGGRSNLRDDAKRDDLKRGDTNRDGIVNDRDSRSQDPRDRMSRDGQNRDPLNRDPLNRDPLNRDPLNRDPLNRDPLNRDPLNRDALGRDSQNRDSQNRGSASRDGLTRDGQNRDGQNRNPANRDADNRGPINRSPIGGDANSKNGKPDSNAPNGRQPAVRPPGLGPTTASPLDSKTLPGGASGTAPALPGRTGDANKGQPENRRPTPGRDSDQRNRDNAPATGRAPGLPNNLPGSSPVVPGSSRGVPSNVPGTSPGVKPGNAGPGKAGSGNAGPGNAGPGNAGPGNAGATTRSAKPIVPQLDRTPRVNPPQPNNAPSNKNAGTPRAGSASNPPAPNIQKELQKTRESSQRQMQRRPEPSKASPRTTPQPPAGAKPEKAKDKK